MYDVTPFLQPVPFNPERSVDLIRIEEDLRQFRRDRSNSSIGQLVREHLGMEQSENTSS